MEWQGGRVLLRPIKPEDAPQHVAFFNALDPEDVRMRMFVRMRELSPAQLARMTQIDYDREMAFIATRQREDGQPETLGAARVIFDPDMVSAEFAISVRSDLKGRGLGWLLMNKLIGYCRERGADEIVGECLSYNQGLIALVRQLGFEARHAIGSDTMLLRLPLKQ